MTDRREFLWSLGAASLGANRALTQASSTGLKKQVIVAGGGIGGLCCAYELVRRGHGVTVLEASGIVGGHVRTVRDGLADGLYFDAGAEHFTKPGYDLYWGYVKEFQLEYVRDVQRDNRLRWVAGEVYSDADLAKPAVLKKLGFNQKEIEFLSQNQWQERQNLYLAKYTGAFPDEYQPFSAGLNDLDNISLTQLLQREGASPAFQELTGSTGSALHVVWHVAILNKRGVPLAPNEVFRLKGGNSRLPDAFAQRLGERVKLGSPVTAIRHGDSGVTVSYRQFGRSQEISGDYLVCCMSAVMLRQIPIAPGLPEEKQWAVANVPYYSSIRPAFQSRTKFWRDQKSSVNIEFDRSDLHYIWSTAEEVPTSRGLIIGTGSPGLTADAALATFRSRYPDKADTIEQAMAYDWSRDPWAMACETTTYRVGELHRFWPALIEPYKRIHFVGAYCDNLNWGQEAATRSANRVALAIDKA
jgi:monoamine oxidase